MKNRAKCKLCNSIIESNHFHDHVICKCGHISVSGGETLQCFAENWENFLRVDDEGNEIIVTVKEKNDDSSFLQSTPSLNELIKMLEEMIEGMEKLPDFVKWNPINHYDMIASLLLIKQIFKTIR